MLVRTSGGFFCWLCCCCGWLKKITNLSFGLRLAWVSCSPVENIDSWGAQNSSGCSGCSSNTPESEKQLFSKTHLDVAAVVTSFPLSFSSLFSAPSLLSLAPSPAAAFFPCPSSLAPERVLCNQGDVVVLGIYILPLRLQWRWQVLLTGCSRAIQWVFCPVCDAWAASGVEGEGETTQGYWNKWQHQS